MSDLLIRALCRPLAIRIVAATTGGLCAEAAWRHRTSPAVTCALGRGLTAGLLLSTLTTGGERVTIQLQGDGPLGGLTVDAYDDGDVRGYAHQPRAWAGRLMDRRQRLQGLLGREGVVHVTRDIGLRDRYQGQVRLGTGEVDEDIEAYLRESEQIPSALGCEVVLDSAGQVRAAGGFLAQVLPGGNVDRIREAQHGLRTGVLYDLLAAQPAVSAEAIAGALLPGLEFEVLGSRPLRFRCRCSRDRVEGMLRTLSALDLSEMAAEGKAEVTCNYCNEVYLVEGEVLLRLLDEIGPKEKN
ncbi:MAG: Hsp33 family molecular chaperone HslO [Myxococcales bacterium]|nr:Hsp33 family molecular chaperone HslO [Myxococcota bacterium]MDW8282371.1 Hsp33 family molecular chaperone HslO [Myxococcales bacterium]